MTANATMTDDTLFTRPAALVEQRLHALLEECQLPPDLLAASQYGVLGGGKRLRPALVVLSCESVEGDAANSLPAAAALELVHCFSLVHDDLPALDNDELRRGQPTLHVRSGEAMAILAGDLMLSMAFQQLLRSSMAPEVTCNLGNLVDDADSRDNLGNTHNSGGAGPRRGGAHPPRRE